MDESIWFFEPPRESIALHGHWMYGDVVVDVCILDCGKDASSELRFAVLYGQIGRRGWYAGVNPEERFGSIAAAAAYVASKVSVLWFPESPEAR